MLFRKPKLRLSSKWSIIMILISFFFDLILSSNLSLPSFLFLNNLEKNKISNIILFIILYNLLFTKTIYLSIFILILYFLSLILNKKIPKLTNIIILIIYLSILIIIKKTKINLISILIYLIYSKINKELFRI